MKFSSRILFKVIPFLFFSIFSSNLFSQVFPPIFGNPSQRPSDELEKQERHKRRFEMERKADEPFLMVFFKNVEDEDYIYLDCAFNSVIKKESIFDALILINGKPIEKDCVLFSRDGHRCKFRVYKAEGESVNIKMTGILSWDGFLMPPLELHDKEKNSMYKFYKETGQWLKFSL